MSDYPFKRINDRGMMKWQGFVLSEHNEDMVYHNRAKTTAIILDEQTVELFNELLLLSYKNQTVIHIEYANGGNPYEPITCAIGYVYKHDALLKGVYLKLTDGSKSKIIPISEIRSITEVLENGI
ncbi:YolD-like family protein [Bacillus sp. 1P06AnD]|uniref:YolD-like family protein n=1 Tax=Bacillus sp. 1P06AnD TaxID=3132208 RepID=UPI0039A2E451